MSLLWLFSIVLCVAESWGELPKGWQACQMSSTEYNDCLINAINYAIKSLKDGNKELEVPSIDPISMMKTSIVQGTEKDAMSVNLELTNFVGVGLSSCKVQNIKNDWKTMEAILVCKDQNFSGHYKLKGKLLAISMTGDGDCWINIGEMIANISAKFKEEEIKGNKHFDFDDLDVVTSSKDVKVNFENIISGNKELSDQMNIMINGYTDDIIKDLEPGLSKAFMKMYSYLAKKIFSKIPAQELNIK